MAAPTLDIGGRAVGPDAPCYVIAEAGVNHNGDPALARALVDAAAEAGADAVKFQTFRAERLVTPDAPKAAYQRQTTSAAESQLEMLRRLELSPALHEQLIAHSRARSIQFLSTPFDEESADLLHALDVPALKLGSGELTNLPLLAHVAGLGRPLIVSTGMSVLAQVAQALDTIAAHGDPPVALLHCVSNYPADPADVNLCAMDTLRRAFGRVIGFSDHTLGNEIALAAVARGASIVEKHFTLDRTAPGPDHAMSVEPDELAALVRGIRRVEAALGDGEKRVTAAEAPIAAVARRSLVAARDLPAGATLTREMIAVKRPGTGLAPARLPELLGRTLRQDVASGSLLTLEMLA